MILPASGYLQAALQSIQGNHHLFAMTQDKVSTSMLRCCLMLWTEHNSIPKWHGACSRLANDYYNVRPAGDVANEIASILNAAYATLKDDETRRAYAREVSTLQPGMMSPSCCGACRAYSRPSCNTQRYLQRQHSICML